MKLDIEKFNIALANSEMNTADLARATGYSLNTIRDYVKERRNPSTKSIGKIARVLNVTVTEILAEE